jgi:hypothetical protein
MPLETFLTITLTALAVILAALGVIVALAAIVGYNQITAMAKATAEKVAGDKMEAKIKEMLPQHLAGLIQGMSASTPDPGTNINPVADTLPDGR